jgi:hypothetical protein
MGILPDGLAHIEPGGLIQFQLGSGVGGNPAAVTYAGALHHRKAGLQNGDRAGNIINHRISSVWKFKKVL